MAIDTIKSTAVLDGAIATADIADDAVTADKLANAINTSIAAKSPLASPAFTGNVGINNGSPTQRLEANGNAQFNAYDNVSGGNGYYTTKGMQIGNAFDAGLSGGDDDRNAILWNERGTSLLFATNNLERMRINASGSMGIGVTPEAWLDSQTALQVGGTGVITSSTTAAAGADTHYGQNAYLNTSGAWVYQVTDQASVMSQNDGQFRFRIAASGTADAAISWTTAMTIANSGHVLFGCTSVPSSSVHGAGFVADNSHELRLSASGTGNTTRLRFLNPNNEVGSIRTSGTATAFNTSSDYRLKTDVQPMTGATDRVKLLKPCNFEWIVDGTRVDGFLAHEAQEVVPEAVSGTKDAMMDEEYEVTPATETEEAVMGTRSVPDLQGIDQSKLVPLLVKTIQELEARITALEDA